MSNILEQVKECSEKHIRRIDIGGRKKIWVCEKAIPDSEVNHYSNAIDNHLRDGELVKMPSDGKIEIFSPT